MWWHDGCAEVDEWLRGTRRPQQHHLGVVLRSCGSRGIVPSVAGAPYVVSWSRGAMKPRHTCPEWASRVPNSWKWWNPSVLALITKRHQRWINLVRGCHVPTKSFDGVGPPCCRNCLPTWKGNDGWLLQPTFNSIGIQSLFQQTGCGEDIILSKTEGGLASL